MFAPQNKMVSKNREFFYNNNVPTNSEVPPDLISPIFTRLKTDSFFINNADLSQISDFQIFDCCALFSTYNINSIYRNYMKYKKRKEIKQYIARKKKAQ